MSDCNAVRAILVRRLLRFQRPGPAMAEAMERLHA
jgi:hypothetical protein